MVTLKHDNYGENAVAPKLDNNHNNLHNFDTWIFFKWIFKTFAAVLVLSNTFNIVMAVFDRSEERRVGKECRL